MSPLSVHRWRHWLALVTLAVTMLGLFTTTRAYADEAAPDKTGAFQTDARRPTRSPATPSPIPEKATTKELATAVDAVAQSASRSYFSVNFVVGAGRGLPGHVHAGRIRAGRDGPDPRQERRAHDVA